MDGFWHFLELARGKWAWECRHPDGTNTRVGPFRSLTDCIEDAKLNGFEESKRERRKLTRHSRDD